MFVYCNGRDRDAQSSGTPGVACDECHTAAPPARGVVCVRCQRGYQAVTKLEQISGGAPPLWVHRLMLLDNTLRVAVETLQQFR